MSLPALADAFMAIRDVTLDDCDIDGPAIIWLAGLNLLHNRFDAAGRAPTLVAAADQLLPVTGVIAMPGCTIRILG